MRQAHSASSLSSLASAALGLKKSTARAAAGGEGLPLVAPPAGDAEADEPARHSPRVVRPLPCAYGAPVKAGRPLIKSCQDMPIQARHNLDARTYVNGPGVSAAGCPDVLPFAEPVASTTVRALTPVPGEVPVYLSI